MQVAQGEAGTQPAAEGDFLPLLALDMDMESFAASWANCDRLSSYVARMVSHNRTDSLLFANLFSSALNELLETAFRNHGAAGAGRFACRVWRAGGVDRIALSLPASAEAAAFYESAIARLAQPEVEALYREALFSSGPLDPRIGLLELAVDYGASLSVAHAPDMLHLTVDLALEEPAAA